uniref:Disease resistance protein At4g27190-like leucine-rich repeats domain-containing protein n=1 Tax=Hordeum vulgare subsp. vulgare TaxID=112509 RepID=A0A8I6YL74_HORVV
MQRIIAEELKLDRSAMDLFDKQDEEDDFSGVDKGSRAEIPDVGRLIFNRTMGRTLLVIFQNGSDDEIDFGNFGIPIFDWSGNMIVWTFQGRFRLDLSIKDKVKSANIYLSVSFTISSIIRSAQIIDYLTKNEILKLVHEEASQVLHDISPTLITDCWLYLCLLYFDRDYDEYAHGSNYWVCDGIIPGEGSASWETGQRVHEAIRLEYLHTKKYITFFHWSPVDLIEEKKKSAWISVTSKNVKNQVIPTVPEDATSYFLTLAKSDRLNAVPKNLFHQSIKLCVLRLSCCTFSFASPPFICCRNLKFILLDSCRDEDVEFIDDIDVEFIDDIDKNHVIEWEFLKSLWVLDIRDTNWDWILSPSKMVLMTELRELNLKVVGASSCVWDMTKLELTWLCNIQILRVIDSSTFFTTLVQDPFMGMQNLELLDLSGNSVMEVLPNISIARRMKVLILDGCAGLKQVESAALPKSLESFSFDGFGRASKWKNSLHMPEKQVRPSVHANKVPPKVSKISLEGCEQLKNVFLRGLPNLKELNLSDTAIQELDLEAMQVLQLECLFILGCRNLRRLKWSDAGHPCLKLLCIDCRGKEERGPINDCWQYDSSQPLVHIVITDSKFLRAFKISGDSHGNIFGITDSHQHFHIHLASSVGQRKVIGDNGEGVTILGSEGQPYMDVLNKVIEKDNGEASLAQACTHHLPLGRHIEIAGGYNWESEKQIKRRMEHLMAKAESFHMHDHPSVTTGNLETQFYETQFPNISWCCIQRCPKLHTVFLLDQYPMGIDSFEKMETLCVSHLLAAQCIWSRKLRFQRPFIASPNALQMVVYSFQSFNAFQNLRYIHLHSCPRLKFVLPWYFHTLAKLETIHITYCAELRQIFLKGKPYEGEVATSIIFPSLKCVHLHELPMLHHICEIDMFAPALETIVLRGCWSLMQLPAISSGRALDKSLAVVDCEKDWWDKLKWDGLEASRPLFSPRHSRYYKKAMPRLSVLR